jgi:hypothetical protein
MIQQQYSIFGVLVVRNVVQEQFELFLFCGKFEK